MPCLRKCDNCCQFFKNAIVISCSKEKQSETLAEAGRKMWREESMYVVVKFKFYFVFLLYMFIAFSVIK